MNKIVKSILVVDRDGNDFKAVSFGYAGLAKEINTIKQQWSVSNNYHMRLIVVYQAKSFLYTVPELSNDNLTMIDLKNSTILQKSADKNTGNLSDTIGQLKQKIQNEGE